MFSKTLFFVGLFLVISTRIFGATITVTEDIATNETWQSENVYVITDSINIWEDITLTVEPGTVIKFQTGASIGVWGTIIANGGINNTIVFTSYEDDEHGSDTNGNGSATSPQTGDWNQLAFSTNAQQTESELRHCKFLYGGSGGSGNVVFKPFSQMVDLLEYITISYSASHGLAMTSQTPDIRDCQITDNDGWGVYSSSFLSSSQNIDSCIFARNGTGGFFVPNNSAPQFSNNIFEGNGYGIYVSEGSAPPLFSCDFYDNAIGIYSDTNANPGVYHCNFAGNTTYAVQHIGPNTIDCTWNYWNDQNGPYHPSLNPFTNGDAITNYIEFEPWLSTEPIPNIKEITNNITADEVWGADTVYVIANNITVSDGVTLTIESGTIVKFSQYKYLRIDGTLLALGVENNQIVFTDYRDDGYGGDTNWDGELSTPSPGYWGYVYLNYSENSIIDYCLFKFGGYNSNGNLYINNSPTTSISNVVSTRSSTIGVRVRETDITLDKCSAAVNNSHGFYIDNSTVVLDSCISKFNGGGNDGVSSSNSNISLYDCEITNNGRHGVYLAGASGYSNIENTIINFNGGYGAYLQNVTGSVGIDVCEIASNGDYGIYVKSDSTVTINQCTVSNNGKDGIWCNNTTRLAYFSNNTINDNAEDGLVSAQASISNNTFMGNRYPIAVFGNLGTGNTYAGNSISGNQYNNCIGWQPDVHSFGTLSDNFPQSITSNTYVIEDNNNTPPSGGFGISIDADKELVITPGLVIKSEHRGYITSYGTFTADGTSDNPIIFTNYHDDTYGGDTNENLDGSEPAKGWWGGLYCHEAGSSGSLIDHCQIYYAGWTYYSNRPWTVGFYNSDAILSNSTLKFSDYNGIYVNGADGSPTFTNCLIDTCDNWGIYINNSAEGMAISGNEISHCGNGGLYGSSNAKISAVANNYIHDNTGEGIRIDGFTYSITIVGNIIESNSEQGIWTWSETVLAEDNIITENQILDNGFDGILTSCATIDNNIITGNGWDGIVCGQSVIENNQISGNAYPIAIHGNQGNTGNSFQDNTITGNTYDNAIGWRGDKPTYGNLMDNFPQGIGSNTYVVESPHSSPLNPTIPSSGQLSITPGLIIKFEYDRTLEGIGLLIADGTADQWITFTDSRDDTYGGDTNADADTTAPAAGWWRHITVNGSNSLLDHCLIQYGGRAGRNVYVGGVGVNVTNSIIKYSSSNGFRVAGNLTVTNSLITENASSGIYLDDSGKVTAISDTICYNNTGIYIRDYGITEGLSQNLIYNNLNSGIYLYNIGGTDQYNISENQIYDNGSYGLYIRDFNYEAPLIVSDNEIHDNGGDGLHFRDTNNCGTITFSNNQIYNNDGEGIFIYAYNSNPEINPLVIITENEVLNNGGTGILTSYSQITGNLIQNNTYPIGVIGKIGNQYSDNMISDNTYNALLLYGGSSYPTFGTLQSDFPEGVTSTTYVAYLEADQLRINDGYELIIEPEVIVKLSTNDYVEVNGTLTAVGTEDWPIVFTSWRDDNYGGDTNSDGYYLAGQPGDWKHIKFSSSDDSQLDHCIFKYGGADANGIIFYYNNGTDAPITNCQISNSGTRGIYTYNSNPTIENNRIFQNHTYGVYCNNSEPIVRFNDIYDNNFGVYNYTNSKTVNATYNWWGDATGPFHSSNPAGLGDEVSNYVDFSNWSQQPGSPVGDMIVSTFSIEKTVDLGSDGNQTFKIYNFGTDNLDISVSNDGSTWFSEDVTDATITPGDSVTITVNFASSGMAIGDSMATLYLTSNDPDMNLLEMPVALHIRDIDPDQHFLVWDPDLLPSSGNKFYDILDDIGFTVDYETILPENISIYDGIFVTLGVNDKDYIMTASESQKLAQYLDIGGNLYLEGGDAFYGVNNVLSPYLHLGTLYGGSGNLGTIEGLPGTTAQGMSFVYSGENNSIDQLNPEPGSGAFNVFKNFSPSYNVCVMYDGITYRTISASFEFGGLQDGLIPNTRESWLLETLDFFDVGGGLLGVDPPQNLMATSGLNGQIPLNWGSPISSDESVFLGYNIYRDIAQEVPLDADHKINTGLVVDSTYMDNNVTNGITYYYVITAVYSVGESDPSNEVFASASSGVDFPIISVSPSSLQKTIVQEQTGTRNIVISNLGDMQLTYQITDDELSISRISSSKSKIKNNSRSDAQWLTEIPASGTVAPHSHITIVVTFSPGDMEVDEYFANIVITSNDADNSPTIIPVQMNVVEAMGQDPVYFIPVTENTGDSYSILVDSAILEDSELFPGDEIGVFAQDNEGELICAGSVIWTGGTPIGITAWKDDPETPEKDGFAEGELIAYRFWDNSEDEESTPNAEYSVGNGTFGFGSYARVDLDVPSSVTKQIELISTWNWISFNVEPEEAGVDSVFAPLDNLEIVINGDGQFYIPDVYDGIGDIEPADGYKIYVRNADTLMVTGVPINAQNPIGLDEGWNFVSFFPDSAIATEVALAGIENILVIAKSQDQFFIPGSGASTLDEMSPGQGYKMYTDDSGILIYGIDEVLMLSQSKEIEKSDNSREEAQHFTFADFTGESYSILIDDAIIDDMQLQIGDEVGVFTPAGLCVGGVAIDDDGLPIGLVAWEDDTMTDEIDGYITGEEIYFKIWDAGTETELDAQVDEYILGNGTFGNGAYSHISQIYNTGITSADNDLPINVPTHFALSQNFPNPFNPTTTIQIEIPHSGGNTKGIKLNIYDISGKLIKILVDEPLEAGYHSVVWNGKDDNDREVASGVYFYRIEAEEFEKTKRMILLR